MTGVEDRDLGWRKIITNLKSLDGTTISAGILNTAGNYDKGQSLVDVAIWNEYGTRRIPSRPFIRIASDTSGNDWHKTAEKGISKIVAGSSSAGSMCDKIGKQMVEDIQKIFGDKSKLAPNSPATIRRKGHDKPLIDTGRLRDSVDYRVDGGS